MKKVSISPKFKKLVGKGTSFVLVASLLSTPILGQASIGNRGNYEVVSRLVKIDEFVPVALGEENTYIVGSISPAIKVIKPLTVSPTPTVTPTVTPMPTVTPKPTSTPLPTATPTPKPKPTPTPKPTSTPKPTATPTPQVANDITYYPNLSEEHNQMIKEIKECIKILMTYEDEFLDRTYNVKNVWKTARDNMREVKVWNEEVSDEKMQQYYEQMQAIEEKMDYVKKVLMGMSTTGDCEMILKNINEIPENADEEKLQGSGFFLTYTVYLNRYNRYEEALEISEPEKIEEYYAEIDEVYSKALKLYNKLAKKKTL